jgi:hypothetical protein
MVQGLGVVLSARRRCWWRPASTFVPAERIQHIVINEVRCPAPYNLSAAQLTTAARPLMRQPDNRICPWSRFRGCEHPWVVVGEHGQQCSGPSCAAQRTAPAVQIVPAGDTMHWLRSQGVGVSRVTCYLALMVEGSDRLEVAFPRLLPRLPLLTPVRKWQRMRHQVSACGALASIDGLSERTD